MFRTSVLCWVSAIVFMTASSLSIAEMIFRRNNSTWSEDDFVELDPEAIQVYWYEYYDRRGLFYAAGFINGFFWIIFCLPTMEMAWILSRSGTQSIGAAVAICVFALGGAMIEWLSHLFWIGTTLGGYTLAFEFNLSTWLRPDVAASLGVNGDDNTGWRDLEVNHIVTVGMIWIVDAFEWLCIAGIFISTFFAVFNWRKDDQSTFGARWNGLGLFIGLLAILEFSFEIVRFEGYKFAGPIVMLYAALNRIILIPAWIISLGFQMPAAAARHFESHVPVYLGNDPDLSLLEELTKVDQKNPTFTIDDDDVQNTSGLQSPSAAIPPSGPTSPPAEAFAAFAMSPSD
ncbi:hypothetical protein IV203_029767 [Nitzschia inconspicua]|uniref:Uncharacterized protein n=1 Tax=Nitzschia inconspicua TaxID=303405 RepID=A0A9K3PB40_9STRA|nr:hypothetical protein IV203_004849 [Nitzschia inconspicua]KAG7367097.1 hypothetical protein IV203_029767 [Nitzschia inconspicua]